ncbi:hypothetical protein CEK29_04630 [Bordetella genomosp. 5]|nr:hypothetical protein CEK29_04630 [Bordetella genomosp. 5]
MQPSRRAFLMGKRPPRSVWLTFLERLEAVATGPIEPLGEQRARLLAADSTDARIARRLCAEYGIALALAGTSAARAALGPCLVVDPARLGAMHESQGRWRVAPGARVGGLAAAGLAQFQSEIPSLTVAAWLAQAGGWPTGGTAASGLVSATVLLADGTVETLGAFGAAATQPLRSVRVQQLVPALFELLRSDDAQACLAQAAWAPRFRLDALAGRDGEVNLAHLFLGHGGALAWIEELEFVAGTPSLPATPDEADPAPAHRLDERVRERFDPAACFASVPAA